MLYIFIRIFNSPGLFIELLPAFNIRLFTRVNDLTIHRVLNEINQIKISKIYISILVYLILLICEGSYFNYIHY